jgi:hypothetical protein
LCFENQKVLAENETKMKKELAKIKIQLPDSAARWRGSQGSILASLVLAILWEMYEMS